MKAPDDLFEKILARKALFKGNYLDLERLRLELPDGRTADREIVLVRDAVAVLPVDKGGVVHLVRQHRAAIGRTLLEVPAGLIEDGETPQQAAVRECEEEIGRSPGCLVPLLTYAHAEGYSTGMISLFVGYELALSDQRSLDESEHLVRVSLDFDELLEKVRCNEIIDSKTILSVLIWENMGRSGPRSAGPR